MSKYSHDFTEELQPLAESIREAPTPLNFSDRISNKESLAWASRDLSIQIFADRNRLRATETLELRLTPEQIEAIRLRRQRRQKSTQGCGFVDLGQIE
jgi:hypothetical protein